jgi:hypothetical protein
MGIRQQPQTVIPTEQLDSDVGDRVICGIMMMPLCNGWGWQPTQTASRIHLRHKQSVWAHWYAVLGHIAAALHSYTQTSWVRCWGTESLVESKWWHNVILTQIYPHTTTWVIFWGTGTGSPMESKWWHNVIVEADSPLKLLPASILDIYKVFVQSCWAHWYAVHGHLAAASNRHIHTTWLICWGSGSLVESKWCHYVMVEGDSHL